MCVRVRTGGTTIHVSILSYYLACRVQFAWFSCWEVRKNQKLRQCNPSAFQALAALISSPSLSTIITLSTRRRGGRGGGTSRSHQEKESERGLEREEKGNIFFFPFSSLLFCEKARAHISSPSLLFLSRKPLKKGSEKKVARKRRRRRRSVLVCVCERERGGKIPTRQFLFSGVCARVCLAAGGLAGWCAVCEDEKGDRRKRKLRSEGKKWPYQLSSKRGRKRRGEKGASSFLVFCSLRWWRMTRRGKKRCQLGLLSFQRAYSRPSSKTGESTTI